MNDYVINSSCFGFGCSINAMIAGQFITRCDWKPDPITNKLRVIHLERYRNGIKDPHFIIFDGLLNREYFFTTQDILSDNWVTVEEKNISYIDFIGCVDLSAPKEKQWEFIKSKSPTDGDAFLTNKNDNILIYFYDKHDTVDTFEFIEMEVHI